MAVPGEDPESAWDYIVEGENKDIGTAITAGFAGLIFAIWSGILNITTTSFEFIYEPVQVLIGQTAAQGETGSGILGVVDVIWSGWVMILGQATTTTVFEFSQGGSGDVGIFTQILALLVVLGGAYIIIRYLSRQFTSSIVPTGMVDLPIITWFTTTPEEEEVEDN